MEKEVTLDQFIKLVRNDFESNKEELLELIKNIIPNILITGIDLTGSYKSGFKTPTKDSDIDLLIKYKGDLSPDDVANKLRGRLYGYGGIYDIVPLKEEVENLSFIQSIVEARVFRYEGDFSSKTIPDMAKALYLMMLLLEALRKYDPEYAKKYARDTFVYGNFSSVRSYATDLHNIIASLLNWNIRDRMRNDNGISVPEFAIKRYFRDVMTGVRSSEKSMDRQFFFKLQSDLKQSDGTISMMRRNLVDMDRVTEQEYRDVVERLHRMLDSIAIYTDIHWHYKTNVRYNIIKPQSNA